MNNVTGGVVALVLFLLLLMKRPVLALALPVSLIVFWDYGPLGVALLWAGLLVVGQRRESREPGTEKIVRR